LTPSWYTLFARLILMSSTVPIALREVWRPRCFECKTVNTSRLQNHVISARSREK
ncbi:hypothetical protein NDU88_001288, partial [Pleurodeles waltl]